MVNYSTSLKELCPQDCYKNKNALIFESTKTVLDVFMDG